MYLRQALLFSLQLRHIENRLEAAPGSGVLLESIMDTKKSSAGATRKVSRRGEAPNGIANPWKPWLLFIEQGSPSNWTWQQASSLLCRCKCNSFYIARLVCRDLTLSLLTQMGGAQRTALRQVEPPSPAQGVVAAQTRAPAAQTRAPAAP